MDTDHHVVAPPPQPDFRLPRRSTAASLLIPSPPGRHDGRVAAVIGPENGLEDRVDDESPTQRRRTQLLDMVRDQPFTAVHELSRVFGVSEVTVRNDLRELEARGRLRRVRGGAIPDDEPGASRSRPSTDPRADEVGRCAASLVQAGDLLAIDAGALGLSLAHALVRRDDIDRIVVVTNSLGSAAVLSTAPWATVVVTGGTVSGPHGALGPPYVGPAAQSLRPDILFIECAGISVDGVETTDLGGAAVREHWLRDTGRIVVLAPASSIGRHGLVRLCGVADVDLVVTDAPPSAPGLVELIGQGVRVLTV